MRQKNINLVLFMTLSIAIFVSMLLAKPFRYGDWNEYYLTTESLMNHLSPDLQQRDIDGFYIDGVSAYGERFDPLTGYEPARDGKLYSQHTAAYPFISLPVRIVLQIFRADHRKVFQITNAVLFILMLAAINFLSALKEKEKKYFMLLLTFSPALWFIHWTHPEISILSFVVFSLVSYTKQDYPHSIAFSVIAAWQNLALVALVAFMLLNALISEKKIVKRVICILISMLVFVPSGFYYLNYGSLTNFGSSTDIRSVSFFRVFELFFDLNIGLLPYIPLTLFAFAYVLFNAWKKKRLPEESLFFLTIVAIMLICSATVNWNHGTSGPSRYDIMILPLIIFPIVRNIRSSGFENLLVAGIITQFAIIIGGGGLIPAISSVRFTPPAEAVLRYIPWIYNPSYEIFCERALQKEGRCADPTIYSEEGRCRKALVTCVGVQSLNSVCSSQVECEGREGRFYVNFG